MKNQNNSINLSRRNILFTTIATSTILLPNSLLACDNGDFGDKVLGIIKSTLGEKKTNGEINTISFDKKNKLFIKNGKSYTINEYKKHVKKIRSCNKKKLERNLKKFKLNKTVSIGVRG